MIARQERRHHAAVRIQSNIRMQLAKRQLTRLRIADAEWKERQRYAATTIQCAVRVHAAKKQLTSLKVAEAGTATSTATCDHNHMTYDMQHTLVPDGLNSRTILSN